MKWKKEPPKPQDVPRGDVAAIWPLAVVFDDRFERTVNSGWRVPVLHAPQTDKQEKKLHDRKVLYQYSKNFATSRHKAQVMSR